MSRPRRRWRRVALALQAALWCVRLLGAAAVMVLVAAWMVRRKRRGREDIGFPKD